MTKLLTLESLAAVNAAEPGAARFFALATAFLQSPEGWVILAYSQNRFEAERVVDGQATHSLLVDVDPIDGGITWTATRQLDGDEYEYIDGHADSSEPLAQTIENETGFPDEDTDNYTLHVED